ncbi:hypothetical protein Tco_0682731 [Tanacetum coccineum]|uniref:Uncharacterized protein n=1 Tax=Tanacetum coccineum TaxID=301880 RepID=A0ABQ4XSW9_9ASTR
MVMGGWSVTRCVLGGDGNRHMIVDIQGGGSGIWSGVVGCVRKEERSVVITGMEVGLSNWVTVLWHGERDGVYSGNMIWRVIGFSSIEMWVVLDCTGSHGYSVMSCRVYSFRLTGVGGSGVRDLSETGTHNGWWDGELCLDMICFVVG